MHLVVRAIKLFLRSFIVTWGKVMGFGVAIIFLVIILGLVISDSEVGDSSASNQPLDLEVVTGDPDSEQVLVEIPIDGLILGERSAQDWESLFSPFPLTYGADVSQLFHRLDQDERVAGVILTVNSPGGTIFGTTAITDAVARWRSNTNKPIIAYIGSIGASGGYWVAVSADRVVADLGTTIGSIGVVSGPFKYYDGVTSEDGGALIGGVVTQRGIETTYITAGKSKDLGNPYRRLTPNETAVMQDSVNNGYRLFTEYVAARRSLEPKEIVDQIGALTYDEQQAERLKLIDAVGHKEAALQWLAERAGLGGDYTLMRSVQGGSFWANLEVAVRQWPQRLVAPPTASTTSLHCPLAHIALVYSGDLSALCR